MAWHVVIAGGGFGGLYAARRLEERLAPESARVTLVSESNFLLYTPILPGAAAGTLEPRHVVVPLREELERTNIRLGRVTGADPERSELRVRGVEGGEERIRYDHLIVSLGSVSRVLPIPGLAEHGVGFKTLSEAIALRNRVLFNLEAAESSDDPRERQRQLTFVFVGAGYAGVEGIAELQDYVADVIDRYPRSRNEGTRWILVEAAERIMPEIPPSLAAFATGELRGRGIEVRTSTRIERIDDDAAVLSTGERVRTRTVCWTAGVRPPPVVRELGLPLGAQGRIDADPCLRVRGHDNVWAVGDAAAVPDPAKRGAAPCPPTAQHAIRQGRLAADNVAAALRGAAPRRFTYRSLGVFVDMGRHKAVATMLGIRLRGFPAWWAARSYHLAMIPGGARRARLLADWTVGMVFGRGSAELGQLGHPPSLGDYVDRPPAAGIDATATTPSSPPATPPSAPGATTPSSPAATAPPPPATTPSSPGAAGVRAGHHRAVRAGRRRLPGGRGTAGDGAVAGEAGSRASHTASGQGQGKDESRVSMGDARRDRIARNEASYRELNEAIATREEAAGGPLMLLCECGDENCTEALHITVADYEAVRANPRHFLVLEGHEIEDVERVVERRRGWVVVEKPEDAAHVVDPRDPRRPER